MLLISLLVFLVSFAQPVAQKVVKAEEQQYSSVVLRGNTASLDWGSNDNPLHYDGANGVWKSEPIALEGGKEVQFKYVYDGNWMSGSNLSYTPPQDGDYVFTFYPQEMRRVDVNLAATQAGSLTLEVTVPEETPGWVTPTLASSKNNFNYTAAPLTKTGERKYEVTVYGEPGETFSYLYSLGGEPYKEERDQPRTVTFAEENSTYEDRIQDWVNIPIAKDITHDFNYSPYTPDQNDAVEVTVKVDHYGNVDNGAVYFTTDGTTPKGKRGQVQSGKGSALSVIDKTTEDGLHTTTFTGTIPAQANETRVKYKIDVWNTAIKGSQFADNNVLYSEKATEFAYYVDDFQSPEWAKESIIYQVFVDRFHDGSSKNNTSVDETIPYDEQLKGWMGGDLQGLLEKLDYIDDLGVNTIWVSPIYEGPYSHGYHPTDFMNIDPRFGSNELMKEFVRKAHQRDIKVIYDLVPNHTSNQHPFFQDALDNGDSSRYYDWYTFLKWPERYETFYGIQELPELNNDTPEVRDYMLNEVVPFWMEEIGVDGFRLDYAKGPSQSFWVDFRHKVKELDSEAFIFGEIWDNLDTIDSYTGKLDGAIDFATQSAIYDTFIKNDSMDQLADSLKTIHSTYGQEYLPATFLDSHDMPRFIYEADGNVETMKMAATLQFTLPGAPIIYYGDEVGLSQSGDHNAVNEWKDRYYREMMIWDEEKQNQDLKAYYEQLIEIRKDNEALTHGDMNMLYSNEDVMALERVLEDERMLILFNKSYNQRSLNITDFYSDSDDLELESLLSEKEYENEEGSLFISLPSNTVEIFEVDGFESEEEDDEENEEEEENAA
ncbi:alpha-glucosidase C-terminal domain-containing protein [Halobacillus sp. KCTC 3957]|uniref:Alpha-glucosidase C-terminal domain-containing protein n=1 Tax=Halobacillus yeomjeoni TaxID=311194 RepID=A0A931HX67_9BACI|nr:alpha-glucosidase C-terminal domain-containing protein [Halobacillus yeomjeoni]